MAAVRPYKNKDKENVRTICLETGPADAYSPQKRAHLLASFCDYYIEQEPENCFVLADEDDNAVGYILCAQDYKRYLRDFPAYVRAAGEGGFGSRFRTRVTAWPARMYGKRFPAHLHIDILPAYQSRGFGPQLMNANIENLRSKNIRGVMLVVGEGNAKAVAFYKKNGFRVVRRFFGFLVMGLELE